MVSETRVGQYHSGSDEVVRALIDLGVTHVFCITGAGNLAIVDALYLSGKFKIVYCHHEQSCLMAAQGYARIRGELGVALVTTGGGTTNSATGLLSANLDSVPVLLLSGNESSYHIQRMNKFRAYGVQGFESITFTSTLTKHSERIMSSNEIYSTILSSGKLALRPRKGAVHIDIPMDIQRKEVVSRGVPKLDLDGQANFSSSSEIEIKLNVEKLLDNLDQSSRPIFYMGNGCRDADQLQIFKEYLQKRKIPYLVTWSALDLFDDTETGNMGKVGIYGDRAGNLILQQCDLIVCLGTRLAIPQVGYDINDFARKAQKWVIEIDEIEETKFPPDWQRIIADVNLVMKLALSSSSQVSFELWTRRCMEIWKQFPREKQVGKILNAPDSDYVHSYSVIDRISDIASEDAVIVTDVGAGLLTGHYGFRKKGRQRFFTSQGLGEMGFGLPAAIGAFFASEPDKQLICLNTDGAIMFNLQDLQLVPHYLIPMKLFIFNNLGYSMISISQKNLFSGRVAGSTIDSGLSFPNFELVAGLFGFSYKQIKKESDFEGLTELLDNDKPVLFEVMMDPNQKYLPRLSTSKLDNGLLVSPPLEDMDPMIEFNLLEKSLGYSPTSESIQRRTNIGEPSLFHENRSDQW